MTKWGIIPYTWGMMKTTVQRTLEDILAFIDRHGISPNKFGLLVVHDHKLIKRLRDGAILTSTTIDKIYSFMESYETSELTKTN